MTARERDPQGVSGPAVTPSDLTRLEAIRERLAKATKGPWDKIGGATKTSNYDRQTCRANADFIGHAWEDIAWLLARLAPATAPQAVCRRCGLRQGEPSTGNLSECAEDAHEWAAPATAAGAGETTTDSLRAALARLYAETADYIRINNLGDTHHNVAMQMARDALAASQPADEADAEANNHRGQAAKGPEGGGAAPPAAGPRESSRLEGNAPEQSNPERPTVGGAA